MVVKEAVCRTGDSVTFNIFQKQMEFLASDCDDVLYGGAAGGGKSFAILIFCAKRRLEYPGSTGIAFRRTFPELEKSLILESQKMYPLMGARWNSATKCWTFPNGSKQFFGYCEKDGDVYKEQSANYHDICFDEVTHLTKFQFSYLTSRCRSGTVDANGKPIKALIRSATNPGGPGHQWVYDRYIKPAQTNKKWYDPETKKWLAFIPARIVDNPVLCEVDPTYYNRLKELPEKKFLALAEGRWDVFEGAYFTEWNEKCVLHHRRTPDSHTVKFLSLDWGFADPACVLWWEVTPLGRVFVYRELYTSRRSPKELAEDILALSPETEHYAYMAASPEIWGKRVETENGGQPIQELLQEGLGSRISMRKANNARVPGWLKIREYLAQAPDGFPWMQVSPNCANLIRTIPGLIHDDKKPEEVSDQCEDHACFVGETQVSTPSGSTRMDQLKVGDLVLTRKGPRPVIDWARTSPAAEIFELTTSDGKILHGTGDHPVWVQGVGFVGIDSLRYGDRLVLCETPSLKSSSSSTTSVSSAIRRVPVENNGCTLPARPSIEREEFVGSIRKFGSTRMARFRQVITSITKIITHLTMRWKTWNASRRENICLPTIGVRLRQHNWPIWNGFGLRPPHGIAILPTMPSMSRLGKDLGVHELSGTSFANTVGNEASLMSPSAPSSARTPAKHSGDERMGMTMLFGSVEVAGPVSPSIVTNQHNRVLENVPGCFVASVRKTTLRRPVYNITVEDRHEYFANGILVKNCESLRYGAMSLDFVPRRTLTPFRNNYEKVFGPARQEASGQMPMGGRSGYGFIWLVGFLLGVSNAIRYLC